MPRSPSRSRSRGRRGDREEGPKQSSGVRAQAAEAAKSGSSEQEIVTVAIRQLPEDIRERLQKLFDEGLLKEGDLDLRSVTVFASLNEGLQARVMNHMEGERIYVANARSKSGFLIATCDKAKTGCLDARGLGAIDPWRTALVAMATPKQKMFDLVPERDFLEKHHLGMVKITVKAKSVEAEVGSETVEVELPITETASAVKAKLVALGLKSIPANRMMLHTEPLGFLKERHTFAYYNLADKATLTLQERKRAGSRFRKDQTVMPRRPKAQQHHSHTIEVPKLPAAPVLPKASLPALLGMQGLPGGLKMPTLPMPGTLPGTMPGTMPGLAPATAPGLAPPGMMHGLFPGLRPPTAPGLSLPGGLPAPGAGGTAPAPQGLLQMPGLMPPGTNPAAGLTGLAPPGAKAAPPGLAMPGGDPKAAALAMMASLGGGALGGKAGGPLFPGLVPLGADPKAAAMATVASMQQGSPAPLTVSKAAAPPGLAPPNTALPPGFNPASMPQMPPVGGPKAQMPAPGMPGAPMPKFQGSPGGNEGAPMGATAKGAGPPPSA